MTSISAEAIVEKGRDLGFADVGFTTADPFDEHRDFLVEHQDRYGWTEPAGIDLVGGSDPAAILPGAASIIVLLENYYRQSFPRVMEGHFGRCYLDDDRVTRTGLSRRIKAFREFLRDAGIGNRPAFNLPHRMTAARAGMGTFGKNCLFYASRAARGSSWVLPIPVVVDTVFEPGQPTLAIGCPDWCRNACIAACPTRALVGNARIDPRKCISYLTYYGEGLTPTDLREPMGMNVYGCDRCQDVCPRNRPWLAQNLPENPAVVGKAEFFDLRRLLAMDQAYFEAHIWPHMFYMSWKDAWRWKMNVARVMGNSGDERFLPDLAGAFQKNQDERVRAMTVWAVGKLGGGSALGRLPGLDKEASALVIREVERVRAGC